MIGYHATELAGTVASSGPSAASHAVLSIERRAGDEMAEPAGRDPAFDSRSPIPRCSRNDDGKTCAGKATANGLPAKKLETSEKLPKLGTTCFFSPCGLLS